MVTDGASFSRTIVPMVLVEGFMLVRVKDKNDAEPRIAFDHDAFF